MLKKTVELKPWTLIFLLRASQAWLAIGIVTGLATGIVFVANERGRFEAGGAGWGLTSSIEQARPNIVVIMADDLDVGSLEVMLAEGLMPNLKSHVIDAATTFTNSFVSLSSCCPSRATFLTGQYPHNHRVLTNHPPNGGVNALDDTSTIAAWLQRAGYRTGYVGKYLNGYGKDTEKTYIPPGWDDWQTLVDPTTYVVYNYIINGNGTLIDYREDPAELPEEYQTDVLAQRAANFIYESDQLNNAAPFFLVVAPLAPHVEVTEEAEETDCKGRFCGTIRPAPRHIGTTDYLPFFPAEKPSFNEEDMRDKPPNLQLFPKLTDEATKNLERRYRDRLASLRAVDDLIGTVVAALDQTRELQNTVIIFTSDNGYLLGEHRLSEKLFAYEESIRVPLFICAPGFSAPQSVAQLVVNNDLAPTIADFAGVTPGIPVDGRSLIPLLNNPMLSGWRKRFLIDRCFLSRCSAVRTSPDNLGTPNQLYVEYRSGSRATFREFYDLSTDPYQLQSLNHVRSSLRREQRSILRQWLSRLKECGGGSCQGLEDQE